MAVHGTFGAALLVHMDFKVDPRRWWNGEGRLKAGGESWQGVGNGIEISGLGALSGTAAAQISFRFLGLDAGLMQTVRHGSEYIKGRRVTVFMQFFNIDPEGDEQAWSLKGDPVPLHFAEMNDIEYSGAGPDEREVTISTRSVWEGRNSPAHGFLTDMDQKARFPDDRGLEGVAGLVNKTVRWP